MNNVSGVQKIYGTKHVIHECLDVLVREIVHGVCEHGTKILVEMLHHNEDVGEFLCGWNDNIDELWSEEI
jgi:hypothetical protein